MTRGKLLIFCVVCMAWLAVVDGADGMRLCMTPPLPVSPTSCSSYTNNTGVDINNVYGCSGGSVSNFEVSAGCGPNVYSGSWGTIETPSGVQPATSQAGPHCYCQIKSINGNIVAASPRWVYVDSGDASYCANNCAFNCAFIARNYSGFRSALFSAL